MRIDTTRKMTIWEIGRSSTVGGASEHSLTLEDQQAILGTIFTGVPFPTIYGTENCDGIVLLQDRGMFTFIQSFIDKEISVEPYGSYDDVSLLWQARLEDTRIHTVVVQPPTSESDIKLIHNRLDTIFNILQ